MLDINQHYLELKLFLEEVKLCPDIILRMNVAAVFKSEVQLYNSSKINHCNSLGQQVFIQDYLRNAMVLYLNYRGTWCYRNERKTLHLCKEQPS